MSQARDWPVTTEKGRWAIDAMEELLVDNAQPPERLLARAKELRAEAAEADIDGYRTAALALADRYEAAASARLAAN